MGVVLQNLVGFVELDILKVLPVDLQDLQTEGGINISGNRLVKWTTLTHTETLS